MPRRYKAISNAPPDAIFLLPDKVQPSYDIRQEKGFFDEIIEEGGGNAMVSAAAPIGTKAGQYVYILDSIIDQCSHNIFLKTAVKIEK